jgi:phage gpG-like protein
MTFEELENKLSELPEEILSQAAEIVAETAVESFKGNFSVTGYDGNPWVPAAKEKKTGSLLIQSGALLNSVRPYYVGTDKVIIAAGEEDKVKYAKAHNEGFTGQATVKAHTRQTKSAIVNVKEHTKNMALPKRQFMGKSNEALERIAERIKAYLASLKHI